MDSTTVFFSMTFAFALGFLVGRQTAPSKRAEKITYQNTLPPLTLGDRARILSLLQQGNKIEAIKLYRSIHQVGLKEAKDAIERLESEM